jgi:hypothetical protein
MGPYVGSPSLVTSPLSQPSGLTSPRSVASPEERTTGRRRKESSGHGSGGQEEAGGSSGGALGETGSKPTPQQPLPAPAPQTYPAVLMTGRPVSSTNSTRVKIPPPVPPRTPKRVGLDGTASSVGKGRNITEPHSYCFVDSSF